MKLASLAPEATGLLSPAFAAGDPERYEPSTVERFVDACPEPVDLGPAAACVAEVIASTAPESPQADARLAPALHGALPITRRTAADPGVWRYLTVVAFPEYVRHRWGHRTWATTRGRFWRPGMRPDSNALGRLWWIAELTRDRADYELTVRVLARTTVANVLFTRRMSHHRPLVAAFVRVLADAPATVVEAAATRLSADLSTRVLEALDERALVTSLRGIRADVEAGALRAGRIFATARSSRKASCRSSPGSWLGDSRHVWCQGLLRAIALGSAAVIGGTA